MHTWRRQARIIHLALVGGVVLCLVTFAVIRRLGAAPSLDPGTARIIERLAVVFVIVAVGASAVLGRRVERGPAEDDESWGRRALGSLIVSWAVAEGAALWASLAWLVTGRAWVLAVAVAALAALALNGPARRLA